MRCRITAILRARATFARFEPRRLATSIAQRLSFENRVMRASRTLAASYSAVRTTVKAYIVSVGGFLGMGTKYVAIDPKAVTLVRQDEKNWKATMNANKDQLKAAPEYKYESDWRKH